MNRPTPTRSIIGCLVTLIGAVGLAACGAQDGDAAFSDIALPTFSKDRVAAEAPVEVRRLFSAGRIPNGRANSAELDLVQADVSPDGRYVTDIEWQGGNMLIRDLATGETR